MPARSAAGAASLLELLHGPIPGISLRLWTCPLRDDANSAIPVNVNARDVHTGSSRRPDCPGDIGLLEPMRATTHDASLGGKTRRGVARRNETRFARFLKRFTLSVDVVLLDFSGSCADSVKRTKSSSMKRRNAQSITMRRHHETPLSRSRRFMTQIMRPSM